MKLLFVAAAAAVVLAAASGAQAARPAPQPDGFASTRSTALPVVQLSAAQARSLGVPDAFLPGTGSPLAPHVRGGVTPDAVSPCGACINTCWTSTYGVGANTSTGSYWEYDQPVWCGNGSWITYLDAGRHWQYVSIWYSADGEAGPFVDGGCVGCVSIHFTLYGYFTWHPPVWPPSHSTLRLGLWLQAYGSAAFA